MQLDASIYENLKKHFISINKEISKEEMRNAVNTVYQLLQEDDLVIATLVKSLYPKTEFERSLSNDRFKNKGECYEYC